MKEKANAFTTRKTNPRLNRNGDICDLYFWFVAQHIDRFRRFLGRATVCHHRNLCCLLGVLRPLGRDRKAEGLIQLV